jgi:thiol-disulfide isomerase/thioredoxin
MIERILIVAVLAVVAFAAYWLYTRRQLQQVSRAEVNDPIRQMLRPGIASVVYFTTPGCIPCQTQQQPALQRLQTELGENIQVVQIDASEQPDLATRWGVMTAPTTFVIDETGEAQAVNHGAVNEHVLKRQLMRRVADVA